MPYGATAGIPPSTPLRRSSKARPAGVRSRLEQPFRREFGCTARRLPLESSTGSLVARVASRARNLAEFEGNPLQFLNEKGSPPLPAKAVGNLHEDVAGRRVIVKIEPAGHDHRRIRL